MDRSFGLGDWINSCGYSGAIEDIGFRSTKIRTLAGNLVTIPNSNLVNSPIENCSRRPVIFRQVTLLISGRTPGDKLRQVIAAIARIFDEDGIRGPVRPVVEGAERTPQVRFDDIQGSDFKLTATYWHVSAPDPEYLAHAERVNLRIVEELQKAGVELAEPLLKKPGA